MEAEPPAAPAPDAPAAPAEQPPMPKAPTVEAIGHAPSKANLPGVAPSKADLAGVAPSKANLSGITPSKLDAHGEEAEYDGEDGSAPPTAEMETGEEGEGHGHDKPRQSQDVYKKKMSRFSFVVDKPLPVTPRQSVVEGPLAYEWESAKSKPHARIISRRYPKWETIHTGEMENLFGWTNQGKANPPRAVLIGRTHDYIKTEDRPIAYSGVAKAGQYKPNPLILSRHKPPNVGCGSGELQNVYGWTRYGKARPPNPLILSRHYPKDKSIPGPGAYDSNPPLDRRIGIRLKSRLKSWEPGCPQPGPNEYYLGTYMCDGPEYSIVGRHGLKIISHSPGPIYDIRQGPCRKKGLSMTFKPFPWKMQKEFPGPSEYSVLPGDQRNERTLLKAPRVKFTGKPFDPNKEYTYPQRDTGPGPGDYSLTKYKGTAKDKPKAIICSRPKFTSEFCGSGQLVNLFGKTRFGAKRPPHCAVISRHYPKDKNQPGPGAYDPHKYQDKRVGITMKPRWKSDKLGETGPGPGDYDLPAMGKGPAYSLVPRFRGNLSILEKVPKMDGNMECRTRLIRELEEKQERNQYRSTRGGSSTSSPRIPKCPPVTQQSMPTPESKRRVCSEFDDMFAILDKYLEI